MGLAVSAADVDAAARRLEGRIRHTALRRVGNAGMVVKCEHEQLTGSFKIRGATNALAVLPSGAVVAASSGNHGLAVATAAQATGRACTVVTTSDITPFKRAAL